jgi:hypothetical protein
MDMEGTSQLIETWVWEALESGGRFEHALWRDYRVRYMGRVSGVAGAEDFRVIFRTYPHYRGAALSGRFTNALVHSLTLHQPEVQTGPLEISEPDGDGVLTITLPLTVFGEFR